MGDEQVLAGPSGTKATPHRILRWKTGNGRDRIHIHDIVISPRFPPPIFCSKAFKFQHKRCALAGPN
jgi:hypothetical protein